MRVIPFCLTVLLASIATSALAQSTHTPQFEISDPGVIATGQRITPAGVQAVFPGRVYGVRFGAANDLWVAAASGAYRLDWRARRLASYTELDGRPGAYALAVDTTRHRILASSFGKLPQQPGDARLKSAVSQLSSISLDAIGDSLAPTQSSGALGDFIAGASAVAHYARPGNIRLSVATLPANDALAVLDADADTLIRMIPLGVAPIGVSISRDGNVAWVSLLGGPKPAATQRSSAQCCVARAERVRVDERGVAERGAVMRVDLVSGVVTHTIPVGRHPTAMAWDERDAKLYVACGNSDSIFTVDTRALGRTSAFGLNAFRERKVGLSPTALALSPDAKVLYVALGGANAVAAYDLTPNPIPTDVAPHVLGLIPTGWYPSSLDVSADGKLIAVGTLLGVGAGNGTTGGAPGKRGRFVLAPRGAAQVIEIPTAGQYAAFSTAVAVNNKLTLASPLPDVTDQMPRFRAASKPIPDRPGEPTPIKHVVFIIRENRTYDQVLGDLGRGAGDTSLVIYGRDVTPNAHALSEQYVTLDHFFAMGGNSADGHQWLTQANETEYPMWPLYFGRSYPSESEDALAYSSGGFLWETAQAKNKRVTVFGEYAPSPRQGESAPVRAAMWDAWRAAPTDYAKHRELLKARYTTESDIPSLDRALVREYPGWTQEAPDMVKAGDILFHLGEWEKTNGMPDLTMVILPGDHTQGTSAGWCAPRSCVADNDLALGTIVEAITKTRFWKETAIFVVEDDAQNGVDHIDGHRTVALAISPFTRRGVVDSTVYTHASMVKTIELILGLPAMSLFDLVATDMRASFIGAKDATDVTPYRALVPKQSLFDVNQKVGALTGKDAAARKRAAQASARMNFDEPDAAPSDALNRILWHEARGWNAPYPAIKRSMVFPMAVDVEDGERKVVRRR